MSFNQKYQEYLDDLSYSNSILESEKRAHRFLVAMGLVAEDLHQCEQNNIIQGTLVDITFAHLMEKVPDSHGKSADSRKAWVQRQDDYVTSIRESATAKADYEYLRRILKVFEEAHTLNRQKARAP